ncbi:hypothetical protein [Clostridium sp. UBA7503]
MGLIVNLLIKVKPYDRSSMESLLIKFDSITNILSRKLRYDCAKNKLLYW